MVDDTADIGIFGGTGIYDSEMLQNSKEITIETPYGKTSDTITIGELDGKKVAFMPRPVSYTHLTLPTTPYV